MNNLKLMVFTFSEQLNLLTACNTMHTPFEFLVKIEKLREENKSKRQSLS